MKNPYVTVRAVTLSNTFIGFNMRSGKPFSATKKKGE